MSANRATLHSTFDDSAAGEIALIPPVFGIRPDSVLEEIERSVLVDGLRIVVDLAKSRGSHLVDAATGSTLLDLYGFYGSIPVGFNHPHFERPEVIASLVEAARTKVANSDVYSVAYATFVKTFREVAGFAPLDRYFFIEGGALAVENALKAAMDWKVRKNLAAGHGEHGTEILHFKNAFHGRSGYTLSLTNTDPRKTEYFARFNWPRVLAPAIEFHVGEPERTQRVAEQEQQAQAQIRQIIVQRGLDIAAIIIEPIQGEGGDNHFRGEWMRALRRICDQHDILLICDEVQTGLGLTGKTWCCQHFGVTPDLLVFGKKTQVCGVMAGPRLDEVKDNCFRLPGRINSTWGGNLTDMVRSTHYLRIIQEEGLVENAREIGDLLLGELQRLAVEEPILSAVRGRGLMIAFDLPDRALRETFYRGLFEIGLLAIRCGERSIRFRPALDFGPDDVQQAMRMLREECRRLRAAP